MKPLACDVRGCKEPARVYKESGKLKVRYCRDHAKRMLHPDDRRPLPFLTD